VTLVCCVTPVCRLAPSKRTPVVHNQVLEARVSLDASIARLKVHSIFGQISMLQGAVVPKQFEAIIEPYI
jgi:hypothetical protein